MQRYECTKVQRFNHCVSTQSRMFVFTEKILSYLNGTNSTNSRSRIYLFVHLLLETLLRVAAVQLTQAREGNHGRGQGVVVQHALDP